MRMWRLLVTAGLAGVLLLVAAGPVAAAGDGTPTGGGAGSGVCTRLRERVADVPGIRARIDDQLDRIDARLDAISLPARRARLAAQLQPRIDALQALDERLTALVARVEARCPGVT